MSQRLLQHQAATSRWTLPLTVTYAALVWAAMVSLGVVDWVEALLVWAAAAIVTAINNREAFLPFYSQSVPSVFLMLITALFATSPSPSSAICATGFSALLLLLLTSYQDHMAPGTVYYAFVMLGLVSVFFPQALCYLPFLWLVMRTKLMNLGPRTFFASLLGIITPYWFLLGYWAVTQDLSSIPSHFQELKAFGPLFHYASLTPWQWTALGMTAFLGIVSVVYFFCTSYSDKIRTRLFNEGFTLLFFVTLGFLALQPSFYPELMAVLIVMISPLAGRMLALSHTKLSNMFFMACVVICILYTLIALWTRSMNS